MPPRAMRNRYQPAGRPQTTQGARSPGKHVDRAARPFRHLLPGMPRVIHNNVYAATGASMLLPRVARDPADLYVPDSNGSTTTVIDQRTRGVVRVIDSGALSQHVNPPYDLRTLYVDASAADRLVA